MTAPRRKPRRSTRSQPHGRHRDGRELGCGFRPDRARFARHGTLAINGISIGAIAGDVSAVTQGRNAATAINAVTNQSGVSAVADASHRALTLTAADGRNIALTATTASAANAQAIQNATGLDISAGANASGNETLDADLRGCQLERCRWHHHGERRWRHDHHRRAYVSVHDRRRRLPPATWP